MKKILVTGYRGFIGQNLTAKLLQLGYEVEGWELGDTDDPPVAGKNLVIHLGAISDTTFSALDEIMINNLDFSVKLHRMCVMHKVNLHYASSASVYGSCNSFDEDGPLNPQSYYAWTKYLFDRHIAKTFTEEITVTGFRYFNVFGATGEAHKGKMASPFYKFSKEAKMSGAVTLFENSERYFRDFVSVENVVETHIKLIENQHSGIFNIGTGRPTSFQEVGEKIATKYDAKVLYRKMPEELIGQYQAYTCANLDKLNSIIQMEWTSIADYIEEHECNL